MKRRFFLQGAGKRQFFLQGGSEEAVFSAGGLVSVSNFLQAGKR